MAKWPSRETSRLFFNSLLTSVKRNEVGVEVVERELLDKSDFESELQRLESQHLAARSNPGSFECEQCELCAACMFSSGCENCYRCTHCRDCRFCTHCSHCADSESCHSCAYCRECRTCSGSAYLVRCISCSDCTYCFGCVGLVKQEFCILNVPYSRQDYFEIVKHLSAQLQLSPLP